MKQLWGRMGPWGGNPKSQSASHYAGPLGASLAGHQVTLTVGSAKGEAGEECRRFPQAARLEALHARVLTMDASSLPRPNLSLSAITTPTHSEDELTDRAKTESEPLQAAAKRETDGDDDGADGAYIGEDIDSSYLGADEVSSAYEEADGVVPHRYSAELPETSDRRPDHAGAYDNYLAALGEGEDMTHLGKADGLSDNIYQFHDDKGDDKMEEDEMRKKETETKKEKRPEECGQVAAEQLKRAQEASSHNSGQGSGEEEEDDDDSIGCGASSTYWAESARGWSERFREATETLRMMSSNAPFSQRVSTTNKLTQLSRDFLLSARTYGKIIISEAFMPDHLKTIQPIAIGGLAGGTKYLVRDILFKFSMDSRGFFQSDDAAAKLAGHELKGVMAYYNCHIPSLHTPMIAVIDFRVSVLPISDSTLCYGSPDAGRTVVNSNAVLDAKMREAARKLNIKEHTVYASHSFPPQMLATAADVEGHHINGQFYLVDLSRVFPPEAPDSSAHKMGHLYRLLRPELVKRFGVPLCSDAFSGFVSGCKTELKQHNQEVREATDYLHGVMIPKFAHKLTARVAHEWRAFSQRSTQEKEKPSRTVFLATFPLKQLLHAQGINLRHLGRVRSMVGRDVLPNTAGLSDTRQLLLIEMCARTLRKIVLGKLRERMKKLRVPLEEPYRDVYLAYLNRVLVPFSERDIVYFNGPLRRAILKKFGPDALDANERRDDFDFLGLITPRRHPSSESKRQDSPQKKDRHSGKRVGKEKEKEKEKRKTTYKTTAAALPSGDEAHLADGRPLLLLRLLSLLHIKLTSDAVNSYLVDVADNQIGLTRFDGIDLASIEERVKHLGIIGHSRGYIYKMKALRRRDKQCRKLLLKALECFEEVLESNPTNKITLRNAGQVCMQLEMIDRDERMSDWVGDVPPLDLSHPLVMRAREYFAQSVRVDPQDTYSLYQYSVFLNRCGDKAKWVEYMLRAIEADPTHEAALCDVFRHLRSNGYTRDAELLTEISEAVDKLLHTARSGSSGGGGTPTRQ